MSKAVHVCQARAKRGHGHSIRPVWIQPPMAHDDDEIMWESRQEMPRCFCLKRGVWKVEDESLAGYLNRV